MEIQLTLKVKSIEELAAIVAKLGASVSAAAIVHASNGSAPQTEDDDTTGDVPAAVGQVDKNGLPWDERIHSTPATITGKGVWRAKRGNTAALVAQVEAELRARAQAPQQQPAPMQQPAPQFQQPQPQFQQPAPMQQPAPQFQQPQPQFQQPVQAQFTPEPQQYDFNAFMTRLQMLLMEKDAAGNPLVDANYLSAVANHVGQTFGVAVGAITDIAGNQQMIDFAIQTMRSQGRWK